VATKPALRPDHSQSTLKTAMFSDHFKINNDSTAVIDFVMISFLKLTHQLHQINKSRLSLHLHKILTNTLVFNGRYINELLTGATTWIYYG
jgi:hypothetical protein